MNRFLIGLACILLSTLCSAGDNYGYPFDDALEATVIGTPKKFSAPLPSSVPRETMTIQVFPKREINEFMPYAGLKYTLVSQDEPAPLIFSIAGTGSSHRSAKMRLIEKAFYQAGFHVISLPSSTYASFITSASSTQITGHIRQDSTDFYRVMTLIKQQVSNKIKVTEFNLIGYSLGGAQVAFISEIDTKEKIFNFNKSLMINPPVSPFTSLQIIDDMLKDNLPDGPNKFNNFFNDSMKKFSKVYNNLENVDFNDDFLYRIYQEQQDGIKPSRLAALIGISFRISLANIMFTTDLMTNGGYIIPKNQHLEKTTSTTEFFKVASRIEFNDYFNEQLAPFFISQTPGMTKEKLLNEISLKSISGYLKSTNKVFVVHNEDDFILAPGEINFFRDLFQERAHIYPRGGHCGNMAYSENVERMVSYFKN